MQLLKNFDAQAIIFDKDGTLIDFDFMWGAWTLQLAQRLQTVTHRDAREALCSAFGYDISRRKVIADSPLSCRPMSQLRAIMLDIVRSLELPEYQCQFAVDQVWFVPNPVILAKPLTDLHKLFTNIRKQEIKIAIATADNRDATEEMLRAFHLCELVDIMICADDGVAVKPAPDMVTTICSRLGVSPRKAVVIGDTVVDLKMARAARAGFVIGTLSGVGSLESLSPLADMLIDTVDALQDSFIVRERIIPNTIPENVAGLNPDPAY